MWGVQKKGDAENAGKRQGASQKTKESDRMAKDFSRALYNSRRWRKCAKAFAESKCYICDRCHNKFARPDGKRKRWIVHHRQPLTDENIHDDLLVYGWDNLQFLCIECHNAVHGRTGTGRQMAFDEEGNLVGFKERDTPHT